MYYVYDNPTYMVANKLICILYLVYLSGTDYILEIDHQLLAFVNRVNIDNDRVMRWALHLQMYRFHVRIVKGSASTTADLLSRCGL